MTDSEPITRARWTSVSGLRAIVRVGTAMVCPLQPRLQARLPNIVALGVSMLATLFTIGAFVWVISWGFSRVRRYVVANGARFKGLYNQLTEWLEGHGIEIAIGGSLPGDV